MQLPLPSPISTLLLGLHFSTFCYLFGNFILVESVPLTEKCVALAKVWLFNPISEPWLLEHAKVKTGPCSRSLAFPSLFLSGDESIIHGLETLIIRAIMRFRQAALLSFLTRKRKRKSTIHLQTYSKN